MSTITEIAPDIYRICTYVSEFDLQFNQFLVKDDEPLLYHTGMRAMFPQLPGMDDMGDGYNSEAKYRHPAFPSR